MMRVAAGAVAVAYLSGCAAPERSTVRVSETERLMGVPWTIAVFADTAVKGRAAAEAAFAEVRRLEAILSDYDPGSELTRLSAAAPTAEPVPLGDDLWDALSTAVAWRDKSGGAFDPTVGPLTALWRQARRSGVLPRADKLAAARRAVGADTLTLDPGRRAASLHVPAMRLDLGGIGMGFAVDRAMKVLASRGVRSGMIDASGDIAVSDPPPGAATWRIEVAALGNAAGRQTIELVRAAVTTSGDAYQAVEIDGVRYSHIVDPRTGLGIPGPSAVTVIAADCTTADALATAASVLGPEAGRVLVEGLPGAAARFVIGTDGARREILSSRWPAHPTQSPR